jgi:hypothetical protein
MAFFVIFPVVVGNDHGGSEQWDTVTTLILEISNDNVDPDGDLLMFLQYSRVLLSS